MTISRKVIKDIEWVINRWAADYNIPPATIRSLFRRLTTETHFGNKSFRDSITALKTVYEQPEYDMDKTNL